MKLHNIESQIFTSDYFQDNPIIIDGGARSGEFTFPFLNKFKALILSYEPNKEACELYRKNRENKNINKLLAPLFEKAIWYGESGPKDFYIWNKGDACLGSFFDKLAPNKPAKYDVKTTVDTISLKEICENNSNKIDLLKLDVEGAEFDILYNAPVKCFEKINQICMETHTYCKPTYNNKELAQFLESKGYKIINLRNLNSSNFGFISCIRSNLL